MGNHDCSSVISKVFLALDGELNAQEEKELLAEVNRCSHCLEHYNIEKSFKDFLQQKIESRKAKSNIISSIKTKIKELSIRS